MERNCALDVESLVGPSVKVLRGDGCSLWCCFLTYGTFTVGVVLAIGSSLGNYGRISGGGLLCEKDGLTRLIHRISEFTRKLRVSESYVCTLRDRASRTKFS